MKKYEMSSLSRHDSLLNKRRITFLNTRNCNSGGLSSKAITELDSFSAKLSLELAFSMLELLPDLNEWNKATVLEILTTSVVPQHYLDTHEMIELALPYLQQVNTYVVLNALKFIMYLLNYIDVIKESLAEKLSNSVIALLDKPPELQFLVLRNVILLLLSRESCVSLIHI